MKYTLLFFVLFVLVLSSCKKDSFTLDCSGTAKSFTTDVSPIMQSSCATSGCHAPGSGQTTLVSYVQISGDKTSIRSQVLNGIMPKTGSLPSAQKNAIICWIDAGAPNN